MTNQYRAALNSLDPNSPAYAKIARALLLEETRRSRKATGLSAVYITMTAVTPEGRMHELVRLVDLRQTKIDTSWLLKEQAGQVIDELQLKATQ